MSEAHLVSVTAGPARHASPAACLDSAFLPWLGLPWALTSAHPWEVERGAGVWAGLRNASCVSAAEQSWNELK